MRVTVNGQARDLVSGENVAALVAEFTDRAAGVAVAVNDTVVPRGSWTTTRLDPGDRVEMLTAVQGG